MKQQYKTDLLDLRCMDCMELMRETPDDYYGLAITDPPYGIHGKLLRKGNSGSLYTRKLAEYQHSQWDISAPDQAYFEELFRVSKNQIIWGGNYFDLPPTRCVIAWDKMQPWENFSQWEMAWTSFDKPAALYKFDNRTGDKIHPTQKPVRLYDWILRNYAKTGDTILDTHGGSFSIAIACHYAGHHLTGCELDRDYFDAAVERVKRETAQMHFL